MQCGWDQRQVRSLVAEVVPAKLGDLIRNPNAMNAMMQMKKIDIAELERAAKT